MPNALAQLLDLGVLGLTVTTLDGEAAIEDSSSAVRVGVHRAGSLPTRGLDEFDILLSVDPGAPVPWVYAAADQIDARIATLSDAASRQPLAAAVAAQVLRMTLNLPFEQSLVLESLAYSMLLASEGFRVWREAAPARRRQPDAAPRVRSVWADDGVEITLARPAARNAVDARLRDALVDALEAAALDPEGRAVILRGEGAAFCAGGDLDEFGQADDPGHAHVIRVLRSPTRLAHALGRRLSAHVHGACIGAGIEIPAAAARVIATPDAFFRLPEVAMGLIPGAGGTASIPRRIGRHRASYMAISGADIDAQTALSWGLIDALDDAP